MTSTTTVKAVAFRTGWSPSATASATYTMNIPVLDTPVIAPAGGTLTTTAPTVLADPGDRRDSATGSTASRRFDRDLQPETHFYTPAELAAGKIVQPVIKKARLETSRDRGQVVFDETVATWKNEYRYGINKWGIAIAFDLRDTDPEQFKFVALHEFGHLIGLRQVEGCSADSSAMTSPYEAGKSPTQPTENDKKGVEKLKAWRDRPRGQ